MSDQQVKVAVIGAGFAGVAMAIRLKQEGIEDFVILERADDVGGVWHYNTYPGCRCDVPSHLYSLSFAPNPEWSHTYSPQPEIRQYLEDCADRFGIRAHLRTGVTMESAGWNEESGCWEVETDGGTVSAQILVNGMGPLTEPELPDVPGIDSFQGKTMHSARWDHDYDLTGKRVASVGTGASAIQYVPEIADQVDELFVFQRTAPWIMPHGDRPIRDRERWLYRNVPAAQKFVRGFVYWYKELLVFGFTRDAKYLGPLKKMATAHREKQVTDPELLKKVTPEFTIGCKRLLPSNKWYRALGKDNVELVTGAVQEVRENSVIDANGVEREVDAIIFGTGFHITDAPYADQIRGREGKLLSDAWQGSPRAYLGTAVPGFPNHFLMTGPNTGSGHSSLVYMIEAQVEHVLKAMKSMDAGGANTIEVRTGAYEKYNRNIDSKMKSTVWNTGGCSSFYIDGNGRNSTQYPDFTFRFRREAERFDAGAYEISTARPVPVAA